VLSAHVVVNDDTAAGRQTDVLDELLSCLGQHFDVEHCTFQIEPSRHRDHEPVLHH
jgi:cobalt-zinc-cadmium efflux system protein